jgi:hypothetical protein
VNLETMAINTKVGIFHNRTLKVLRNIHFKKELKKTMARLANVVLIDRKFYNFFECN